jgi:hypothetical protein
LPKSLYCIVEKATFEDFSNNILTLRIPTNFSTAFTQDTKTQFEEILAQELHKKIRVEAILDDKILTAKVEKDKISNQKFLQDILNNSKNNGETADEENFDIKISTDENLVSEDEELDFMQYTLKIFETTHYEKIYDEE